MLAYFPKPYRDELLYSLIARYRVHTGQEDYKSAIGDLFEKKAVSAVSDLPSHLSMLEARIKSITGLDADKLIDFHTLAPAYIPFLHPDNAKQTIKSMKSNFGGDIHVRTGICASKVKLNKYFRVCPKCLKDQQADLGEAYWLRLHQLPGVTSCVGHGVSLCSTKVNYRSIEKHKFQAASFYGKLDTLDLSVLPSQKENVIQAHYCNLLDSERRYFIGFHQWFQFYLELAAASGLNSGKRVDHEAVYSVLKEYWQGTSLAHYLEYRNSPWLIDIFRKHRKAFSPVRHLMVWAALLPERNTFDILNLASGFSNIPPKKRKYIPTSKSTMELSKLRSQWIALLKKHPDEGIKELRADDNGGRIYSWLYRNDRLWLKANKPEKIKNEVKNKIDYDSWDKQICEDLKSIKKKHIEVSKRPRLSRSFFIKLLDRPSTIEKNIHKLPLTNLWLEAESETVESYQEFRVRRSYEQLILEGVLVKPWKLIRKSGLRKEKISNKLNVIINNLANRGIS